MSFWDEVYDLREKGKIGRVWKAADLSQHLPNPRSTIDTYPANLSVTRDGDLDGGNPVLNGHDPVVWRYGGGPLEFRLIEDPDDDETTQHREKNLSLKRADALRNLRAHNQPISHISVTSPAGSYEEGMTANGEGPIHADKTDSSSISAGYESFRVHLTDFEHESMSVLSPTGKAMEIVRKYFVGKYGEQARIKADPDGPGLSALVNGEAMRIEVVGSPTTTIAWNLLEVATRKLHDTLKSGDAVMYYVTDVNSKSPQIYVLKHGRDFYMEQKPKWWVKPVKPENREKYPLRGLPYRYDDPDDLVALGDWEALK